MAIGLRILVGLECVVCEDLMPSDDSPSKQMVNLVGAEKYAYCICCGREVVDSEITKDYKNRWDEFCKENP